MNKVCISEQFLIEADLRETLSSIWENSLVKKFLYYAKKLNIFKSTSEEELKKIDIDTFKFRKKVLSIVDKRKKIILRYLQTKDIKNVVNEFILGGKLITKEMSLIFRKKLISGIINKENLTRAVVLALLIYPSIIYLSYSGSQLITELLGIQQKEGFFQDFADPGNAIKKVIGGILSGLFGFILIPAIEELGLLISKKQRFAGSYLVVSSLIDTVLLVGRQLIFAIHLRKINYEKLIPALIQAFNNFIIKVMKFVILTAGSVFGAGGSSLSLLINIIINNFQRIFFFSPVSVFLKYLTLLKNFFTPGVKVKQTDLQNQKKIEAMYYV